MSGRIDPRMAKQGHSNDQTQEPRQSGEQAEDSKTARSLDKSLALLQANDDTSRFVGLALLKSMLDNHEELRSSKDIVARCWKAIPASFLDRLLKARPNAKRSKEEAQNMISLAVAIVHAFLTLLPQEDRDYESFKISLDSISAAEPYSSRETASQISQISLSLCLPFLRLTHLFEKNRFDDLRSSPYLFIKMLLVDIRSTLPSLQEKLNSPDYQTLSARLAESYDIVTNFIAYLVRSLDEDDTIPKPATVAFEPSQLLQLRKDISETISLTIEHLRDRYDASVAGAAGLHPSARVNADPISGDPKAIAWDSSSISMSNDPLTLSETRTLALWLREDDNDNLRREAAGVMDVMLGLYASEETGSDIRSAVATAFEGIFAVPEGIEAFLREEGWKLLTKDLQKILASSKSKEQDRGYEIVRALLNIAESEVVGPSKEEWVEIIDLAIEALQDHNLRVRGLLELRTAVCQLAVEVWTKLPKGVRRKPVFKAKAKRFSQLVRSEANKLNQLADEDEGAERDLMEVLQGIEDLNI